MATLGRATLPLAGEGGASAPGEGVGAGPGAAQVRREAGWGYRLARSPLAPPRLAKPPNGARVRRGRGGSSLSSTIEAFIARWQGQEDGAERANYALFLSELCDVLEVARPEPASAAHEHNDYVFERAVIRREGGETVAS